MNATLYNKRRPVMDVHIEDSLGKITEIGDIYDPLYLPIILQHQPVTLEAINKWLDKRKMPSNREGLADIRKIFGPFENYRNMFSLVDQYWFKRSQKDSWDKLNFFTHQYPTAVGEAQFTPWTVDKALLKKQSPDITTNGVCKKQWVQDENMDSYLIKAGSKVFNQEPLSEILATMTLKKLRIIPYVSYDISINGMCLCSKSKNFVDKDTEFVPAQHIFSKHQRTSNTSIYDHMVNMAEEYGILDARDYLDKMILVDMVIGNPDRHLGNFGFLRNADTGKLIGFAPLFDFGSAFNEFNPEKKEAKNRFFGDQEIRVFKKYRQYVNVKELNDTDDVFEIINLYPDLSVMQKAAIKDGIKTRVKKFMLNENYRSERSR